MTDKLLKETEARREHRAAADRTKAVATGRIALVGSPNVGKSVLFGNLTGVYVTVSNYPGTTVEVSRGSAEVSGRRYEVVDTPGMYSLLPLSEDERVARDILMDEAPDLVLYVVDATNAERMLLLTFQLMEAGLPVVLVLNMMDEAEASGVRIDPDALQRELGIPVVPTVCTTGRGMPELKRRIAKGADAPGGRAFRYGKRHGLDLEELAGEIGSLLTGDYRIERRGIALLLLQGDEQVHGRVRSRDGENYPQIRTLIENAETQAGAPLDYLVTLERHRWATDLAAGAVSRSEETAAPFREKLSRVLVHPVTGLPILLAVLYLGLYKVVGQFGAGTVVDFLETNFFENLLNPGLESLAERLIPWATVQSLFVGEYGIFTLGLRYAVAIVLPIVALFFLVFAVIEDVGYLPRLALLLDRTFKKIGLSGRAVIPMVLGFGCATMATMVTRTLSSKRERFIATLLLSVAVPCSAQIGVILALLAGRPLALAVWALVVGAVYLLVGVAVDRIMPGKREPFYVEVPPLRLPRLKNVLTKTAARVKWYFLEILPLFLLASVLIWLGRLTGLFGLVIGALRYPVRWIGMPAEAAQVFLFGFFRRDYGAAGLHDLHQAGSLTGVQLVVGAIALTLFMPCVAQFLMTAKERGWAASLAIAGGVVSISFTVAFCVFQVHSLLGITL